MINLKQKGAAHILAILILLAGIIAGVYLVQHPAIFKPKAYFETPFLYRQRIDSMRTTFKLKAFLENINPFVYRQRIDSMRTTFKLSEDLSNEQVQTAVKDDLFKSDVVIEGDIAAGDAQVKVMGDCLEYEQTNYALSEYEAFPPLCFTEEQKGKAIEFVRAGAESAADFVVPYSQAKKGLELGSDIEQVRYFLKKAGIADRIQVSLVSGPDSGFDGFAVTLIRIKELEEDVKQNPDGSGDLTFEQEEARREYVAALRNLWEKQHNLTLELAGIAAISIIDKPLKIVGEFAKPVTKPLVAKAGETKNAIFDFLNNSWGKLTGLGKKVTEIGFNQISRLQEAKNSFIRHMLPIFKPEEREEALKIFERWYTGNYNPATGKLTLYRFVDLSPEMLNDIIRNGVRPRGVDKFGSIDELLKYLDQGNNVWDKQLANAYRDQQAGRDISEFIERFADSSGGGYSYDIATYWTTEPKPAAFFGQNRQYRMTVELDPTDAWRDQTAEKAINQEQTAKLFIEKGLSFEQWKKGEFEWTVLGEVPGSRIKEIIDLSSGKIIYAGGILLISPSILETESYLNCSYSQEDLNCTSGETVCTGHTDDEKCAGKKPEQCFNVTYCQYDQSLGSSCSCYYSTSGGSAEE